jgi:molybdopterin molybdotransferase
MLNVDAALQRVLARAAQGPTTVVPTGEALGLVLADDVASDVDSPPHDKALVDGYAVRAADVVDGRAELTVLEEVTAGAVPTRAVTPGHATRIMTGAPLPDGADSVVMVEQTTSSTDDGQQRVRLEMPKFTSGQNIMRRAASMAHGDVVLRAGARLRAIESGVLAEVGRAAVKVVARPSLAVLSTGNELVPSVRRPGPGQIRNSNGPLLVAAAQMAGATAHDLGIAIDDAAELRQAIARGLGHDVLLISGGVSAGVLDLVPSVLADLGVEQVFHKVNLKPGKPVWFGVRSGHERSTLVFGLPGNPVSSFVCFELFVRPALGKLAGRNDADLHEFDAPLAAPFNQRSDRPTYHPARLQIDDAGQSTVEPLRWQGSGDLRTLVGANALAYFPPGAHQFETGQIVRVLRLPAQ